MRHTTSLLFIVILTILAAAVPAAARQPPARVLSLDEALQLAEARSEQMEIARAGVDRAGGEHIRARSDLFPQLSGAVSYDRAFASEFSDVLGNGTSATPCPAFVANPGGTAEQRLAELERAVDCGATGVLNGGLGDLEDLPFGQKNTYRFSFWFSQNLYSGGRIRAQTAIANASRQTAQINLASTRAQLMLDVVRAYYDAALTERLVEIAEATYRQADATYEQTQLGYKAGSQPEFELLRAQVARDNQRPGVIRRRSARDLALIRLKQLLEIPPAERIAISVPPLDAAALPPPAGFAVGVMLASDFTTPEVPRTVVRQAETQVRQREAGVDVARAQRLPIVDVTSSYGEVAYPSGAFPGSGDFRRNWTLGAIVQMPILTGGRLRADEAIARADMREATARLQQARELALLDTQTAYEELRAAYAAWEASAGTVQQAQRAYEIAELRYREGVSTQLELSDARLLLAQSQATRAETARDLQVARARIALLPDLPLSTTGSGSVLLPLPASPETPTSPSIVTRPVVGATMSGVQGAGGANRFRNP